ncbi:MAG TPA: hypothetical protein PL045_10670 [Chitinophagaceae bacterium]|nr:hypothetical protein [Chitinophagaceae bacterium]
MIHRNNYEEFFLMYVDDELTAQQRTAVELFVMENPDLAAEFHLMQQTKLPADDTFVFAGKESLMKASDGISMENYEEYFLLYIDNELDEKKRKETELFVLQHPQLQEAFTLLKQTVLEKEKIVFENKDVLYQRERRVIPLVWQRIAVAASFILIAGAVWMLVPKGKEVRNSLANEGAKTTNPKSNKKDSSPSIAENKAQQLLSTNTDSSSSQILNKENNNAVAVKQSKQKAGQQNKIAYNTVQLQILPEQNETQANVIAQNDNNETLPPQTDVAINSNSNNVSDNSTQQINNYTTSAQANALTTVKNDNSSNNIIQPAVYKVLNTDDDVNNNSLYVGSMALNKNKVRGFMKKMGGIFSSKTKNASGGDDGKLQVANLEFKTN